MKDLDYLEPLPGYLTVKDFAVHKGVVVTCVRRAIANEEIKAYRFGSVIVIPLEELGKYNPKYSHQKAQRVREIMKKESVARWTAYRYLNSGHRK